MTVRFSKRQLVFLFTFLIVIAAFFAVLYVYTLKPLYNRMDELSATVDSEKQLLAATKAQVSQQQTQNTESVVELEKKVPVKPLVEQLLLDLEKAEVISDSFISNMTFNEEAEINSSEQSSTTNETNDQKETKSSTSSSESSLSLPSGLKKISVQLTVQSPSYYQLERFLQTLEELPRIVSVESLSFTGNPELTSIDTEVKPLTYSLTISAFYHPGLAHLQNELPPLDVPPPSEKRNPLTEITPNDSPKEEMSPGR
ncbi:pilus assembly protein PilO [Thermaerobacillus caldiproteolyticus]|uniref:pilus assembly protein PilO n=1 Tax=Thermaerobacillus caldiproteolyticus TaxID=247480 RepID=UPI00188AD958|nr:pilus assembly protein PilO [Anoxybacillus caldiproteolyticus]QPA30234.1 pilus assembly protein PilO [Anoxybacillus caldiproteolyticus]